jgi:MFS family permease
MNEAIKKSSVPPFYRWVVLIFISLAMFGNYYIYDSISPVADLLKQQLGFSSVNIGTLNGIYSLPNIIMVLIGGIIIDRIGTKKATLLFTIIILIGGFITAMNGSLITMAIGRLIFGLGAESMIVAINTAIARWFKGRELAFAFGLNLAIGRAGSVMALNSPSWAIDFYNTWQGPLWIAAFTGALSLFSIIIYYGLDAFAIRKYNLNEEGHQDKINLKEALSFSKSFWFITALCVTFYSAIFPFQTFAVNFFKEYHHESRAVGGFMSSMLAVTAMIMTPIFGLLSDKMGKRSMLMMLGSLLLIPVFLLLTYAPDIASSLGLANEYHMVIKWFNIDHVINTNLLIPMMMMGISFSLIPAIMWPTVALIVEEKRLGTAYGLMNMVQNAGLLVFNILIGTVNDIYCASSCNTVGYLPGMYIFTSLGFFGFFFALLLRINQRKNKGMLE